MHYIGKRFSLHLAQTFLIFSFSSYLCVQFILKEKNLRTYLRVSFSILCLYFLPNCLDFIFNFVYRVPICEVKTYRNFEEKGEKHGMPFLLIESYQNMNDYLN